MQANMPGNPTSVNRHRGWRKHLYEIQGFIHQICRRIDGLANTEYLMCHWPSASEDTSVLDVVESIERSMRRNDPRLNWACLQ